MTVKEFRRYLKIPKNSKILLESNKDAEITVRYQVNERKEWTLIIGTLEDDNKLSSPQTTEDPGTNQK